MFKITILQKYYNLSDYQTEFQIKDRLSFVQFLGLELGDNVPDENTIWDFKEALVKNDLSRKLFDLFEQKLQDNDIVAKEGIMVDASFISVPKQRNSRQEKQRYQKRGSTSKLW